MKPSTSVSSSISSVASSAATTASASIKNSQSYALRVFLRVRPPLPHEPHDESPLVIDERSAEGLHTVSVAQRDNEN